MKPSEIRELSLDELREKVIAKEEELANLRFQHSLHQLDNSAKVRIERRELARLKTILNQFEHAAAQSANAESN